MVIGDIERCLMENRSVEEMAELKEANSTLIRLLPEKLVGGLYLKALDISFTSVLRQLKAKRA